MFCPTHCFLSKCAFCFNVLLSGLVGNSLSDWTLRCITWNVNATMSSQLLNHCISSYFSKYYSQLCLTLFEVVFRRTSGPSITPSVIPQTLTDELLSIGLGSSHQGQELYHRGFQCRAHHRLLRDSRYIRLLSQSRQGSTPRSSAPQRMQCQAHTSTV